MINSNYDHSFKVLLIGESGVGKTCLLLRFTDDTFHSDHQTTIGVDFKQKTMIIKNKIVKIQVWDTAGQERFRTLTNSFYRIANGIVLTYDVTNQESFLSIKNWIKQVDQFADKSVCKLLVGNKCDNDKMRIITYEQGDNLAKSYGIPFFETSAKNNIKVTESFSFLTEKIMSKVETYDQNDSGKVSLQRNDEKIVLESRSCLC